MRDPRLDPKVGDRLKNGFGDEYTVTHVDKKYVHDHCDKGADEGSDQANYIEEWLTFWGRNSEVLHAAD